MKVRERQLVKLVLSNGRIPFDLWFEKLRDQRLQIAVDARMTRIQNGNFGDHRSVGDGIFELRIDKGPGLRVYYGVVDDAVVVLIGGGDKSSQKSDIKRAKRLWGLYKSENTRL